MDGNGLIILPLLGAFIGWLTNKIALWMLYHPTYPRGLRWLTWQGLIPKRRKELAQAITRTVTEKLLTEQDLNRMLDRVNLRSYLREVTDAFIERRLTGTVRGYSVLPNSIRERLVATIKEIVAERLPARISDLSPGLAARLVADLDMANHLHDRIMNWPMDELERVTKEVAGREMRGIEMAGAVLGFLIGMIQALISFLV